MTIAIRAAEPFDFEAIRETMAQSQVQANTMQLPFPSLEIWKKRLAEFPAGDHMLVAEYEGKVVGNLGLHVASKAVRRRHAGMIGVTVHDAYQRKGIGSALMKAALDLADHWMHFTRLELTVFTDNAAAIALYKKFGFQIEGTFHQYAFRNGIFADVYSMARIR